MNRLLTGRRGAASVLVVVSLAVVAGTAPALAAARREVVVATRHNATDGTYLVTTTGFTLYTYKSDKPDHSNCNGSCLALWPALTVAKGVVPVGRGVTGLGVFRRSNGAYQVTWHKKPLYRWTSDKKAGEVTGQGVAGFSVAVLKAPAKKATTTTTTKSSGGYGY